MKRIACWAFGVGLALALVAPAAAQAAAFPVHPGPVRAWGPVATWRDRPAPGPAPAPAAGADDIAFVWPAQGAVVSNFDESKNKGVSISGKVGDPVLAAADGRVVYAGAGLRGYGNLIIIKHDNTYLTAYAHNRSLSVKEGDTVKKDQKIAEMGDTDTNSVKLHFELRVNGKPVNPTPYLQ